ncbi:hypothetical protein ACFL3I_09665 [Pseudomonadota bacterium]
MNNGSEHKGNKLPDKSKQHYQKPRILSVESLEVIASTCALGKSSPGDPNGAGGFCGTDGPLAS